MIRIKCLKSVTCSCRMGVRLAPMSIMDYIGRWLQFRFLEGEQLPLFAPRTPALETAVAGPKPVAAVAHSGNAPFCSTCGTECVVTGTCHMGPVCATSVGGCS